MLAPVAGYSVMFFVWALVWIALALMVHRILPAFAPVDPEDIRARHVTRAGGILTSGAAKPPARVALTRRLLAMIGSGLAFYLTSGIWRPYLPGFLAL